MNRNIYRIGGLVLVAAVMAGCGGGDGGGGGAFLPIAPIAGASPPPADQAGAYNKFVAYVQSLVGSTLDAAEPTDVVVAFDPPPTSETNDPVATP